jgi:hypothetical protein
LETNPYARAPLSALIQKSRSVSFETFSIGTAGLARDKLVDPDPQLLEFLGVDLDLGRDALDPGKRLWIR